MSLNLFNLSGRLALVTGSSQGIGLAMAAGLARAGAHVVLNGRDPNKLEIAAKSLIDEGLTVSTSAFDVSDSHAVEIAVAAIEENIGPIDVDEAWHDIFKINVDGVFFVARAVGRRMIVRNRGKIVNIGSVQSELGRPTIVPYTATTGAVKMMTKGLCAEWAKHGIQVNAIAPGYFVTELNKALVENKDFSDWLCKRTPAGRWGNVEELVGAAIFLSSMASNFVNGHVLMVDGGLTASV